jgi:hypothetical protein
MACQPGFWLLVWQPVVLCSRALLCCGSLGKWLLWQAHHSQLSCQGLLNKICVTTVVLADMILKLSCRTARSTMPRGTGPCSSCGRSAGLGEGDVAPDVYYARLLGSGVPGRKDTTELSWHHSPCSDCPYVCTDTQQTCADVLQYKQSHCLEKAAPYFGR